MKGEQNERYNKLVCILPTWTELCVIGSLTLDTGSISLLVCIPLLKCGYLTSVQLCMVLVLPEHPLHTVYVCYNVLFFGYMQPATSLLRNGGCQHYRFSLQVSVRAVRLILLVAQLFVCCILVIMWLKVHGCRFLWIGMKFVSSLQHPPNNCCVLACYNASCFTKCVSCCCEVYSYHFMGWCSFVVSILLLQHCVLVLEWVLLATALRWHCRFDLVEWSLFAAFTGFCGVSVTCYNISCPMNCVFYTIKWCGACLFHTWFYSCGVVWSHTGVVGKCACFNLLLQVMVE